MTNSSREDFLASLSFGVDDFQLEAFDAVDGAENVLVSAPTGSGKTLIATYAIERATSQGRRSFYTTPLKALSNQKYGELVARFGPERVGLLTGDTSLNREADIVVMTTEVLRNMLLADMAQLSSLGLVVLDEVHFLQDPFRGGVWEEVIILTPQSVQFVALSATVANAHVVGEWLSDVRGPTKVIVETERPITLHTHVAVVPRGEERPVLWDLLDNGRLSSDARRIDATMKSTRRFRPGPQWKGSRSSAPPAPFRSPRRSDLLAVMADADLLPGIVFIFSRAACDDAVRQVRRDGLVFTAPEERQHIAAIAEERLASFSNEELTALEVPEFLDALTRGIAAHHAGMVPAFREIVEACFEANLLGVVFATETLALGINMPARSVVIERFTKYSDAGRSLLNAGEFTQLTGRAGRRGLDSEGHAIVAFAQETSMLDIGRVAVAGAPELHSSFRPTYNFTANLMHHVDRERAEEILRLSYAQFEADRRTQGPRRSLVDLMTARQRVLDDLGYAEGWRLLAPGERLRGLYHECDLLIAETARAGLFENCEPATLAGVLSSFVFEARRARNKGPHQNTPTKKKRVRNDRLGDHRRGDITERLREIAALATHVTTVEEAYRVPHVRDVDGGFASTIAAWVRGAPLATVLELAEIDAGFLSPGDFVRNAKQVADLCEQVARWGSGDLVAVASETREAILRSIVASASVHPL